MPACSAYGCTNRSSSKHVTGITFHRFPINVEQRQKWIIAVRRKDWLPSKTSVLCSEHFSEDQIDRTSVMTVRLRKNAVPNIFKGFSSQYQNKKKLKKIVKYTEEDSLLDSGSSAYSNFSDESTVREGSSKNTDPSADSYFTVCSNLLTNSLNGKSNYSETEELSVRERSSENKNSIESDSCSSANSSLLRDLPYETTDFSKINELIVQEGFSETKLLKKKLDVAEKTIICYENTIKTLQEKNKRSKNKIKVLTSLLCEIKEDRCITEDELEDFLKICVSNQKSNRVPRAPHQELCTSESSEEFESE